MSEDKAKLDDLACCRIGGRSVNVCQECLGKCCCNIDTGYRCQHMGAQVYMHDCDYCIDGIHSIHCSWANDWHSCNCGAFD